MQNPKLKILCVEDDSASCEILSLVLSSHGYEVVVATSFDQALDQAANWHFDAYVLDRYLPAGDGLDLCRKIRAYDPHVPIIITSADARAESRQRALEAGAQAFLAKPIDPYTLLKVLNRLVRKVDLQALDAKVAELSAIRDEIAERLDGTGDKLAKIKEMSTGVSHHLFKIKAHQAYIAGGGTNAMFERVWPEILRNPLTTEQSQAK